MNVHQAIDQTRSVIRRQHKALATEETYIFWLWRYISAVQKMPPDLPSEKKLERFLTDLACKHDVADILPHFSTPSPLLSSEGAASLCEAALAGLGIAMLPDW